MPLPPPEEKSAGNEVVVSKILLLSMILSDTPKGAGKKDGKPTKKYGRSSATVTVQNYNDPFNVSHSDPVDDCASPSNPYDKSELHTYISLIVIQIYSFLNGK